jgi:hypothetical protein
MAEPAPFVIRPAQSRAMPWRAIVDSDLTAGVAVGDARLPPRTADPNRHVHIREDEAHLRDHRSPHRRGR